MLTIIYPIARQLSVGHALAHGRTEENVSLPQGQAESGHSCVGGTD